MKDKLLKLWIFFMLIFPQQVISQNYQEKITAADSLFYLQKYPEALQAYETIFQKSGKYSLSMLLKMAVLWENAGDYSKSLFYLNVFYRDQPNKKVLSQMEFLADKYKLKGYSYTDLEYFISLYNEFYYSIIVYILCATLAFLVYLAVLKARKKKLGLRPLFFICILMSVYYITNYRVIPPRAIIAKQNALLMSAPSAASEVISMAGKGHRVTINKKRDIWYEINWANGAAYIREDDLFLIPQNQKSLF